uniref:Uncharacterized protein n=1 Tax=Anguilla anguilla TaxID=7936 RepID=A0A0E9RZ43_ANGAN
MYVTLLEFHMSITCIWPHSLNMCHSSYSNWSYIFHASLILTL